MSSGGAWPPSAERPEVNAPSSRRSKVRGIIPPPSSPSAVLPLPGQRQGGGGWEALRGRGDPTVSQDGLPDDADEAVGPLGLCSLEPPLGSGPPRRDAGAQVPAAPQVQEARPSRRGRRVGPGRAGLQRGHYLGDSKRVGEALGRTRGAPPARLLAQPRPA